jgi:hypothetical protein
MESGTYAAVVWTDAPSGIDTVVGDVPPGVGTGVVDIGEEEPPPHPASVTTHKTSVTTHEKRLARWSGFMNAPFAGRKCARLECLY